jgi:hypothetical protein
MLYVRRGAALRDEIRAFELELEAAQAEAAEAAEFDVLPDPDDLYPPPTLMIESQLSPIYVVEDEEGEISAPEPAGRPQEPITCCIAACCSERPVFTSLRCCRNDEACIDCVAEHVRRNGWTCPMCRGDMRR